MLLLVDLILNEIFIMICNQTTNFVWRPCPINMCTSVIVVSSTVLAIV